MSTAKKDTVRAKTAATRMGAPLEDILRWAGREDGGENIIVSLSEVQQAKDEEVSRSTRAAEAASRSSHRGTAQAGRRRQQRNADRVQLVFPLEPEDRQTLEEIQAWVDEQRAKCEYELPDNWRPERKKKGDEAGTISYLTPIGWVDNIPVMDFRRMEQGLLAWALPEPNPPVGQIRAMARKLEQLRFQDSDCRMCGKPIEPGKGPEFAQIHHLLKGRFVLPYIRHSLAEGQTELRFRRLHLLHALWEETVVDVQLRLDEATDEQIVKELTTAIPRVHELANRRRPGTTEDEVINALDEVLAYWEETVNG